MIAPRRLRRRSLQGAHPRSSTPMRRAARVEIRRHRGVAYVEACGCEGRSAVACERRLPLRQMFAYASRTRKGLIYTGLDGWYYFYNVPAASYRTEVLAAKANGSWLVIVESPLQSKGK